MMVCPRSLQLVDVSFLPFDASTKDDFSEYKEFLVVTSRKVLEVLWRKEGVDEGE